MITRLLLVVKLKKINFKKVSKWCPKIFKKKPEKQKMLMFSQGNGNSYFEPLTTIIVDFIFQ